MTRTPATLSNLAALPNIDGLGNTVITAAGTILGVAFIIGGLIFGLGGKWGKLAGLVLVGAFLAGLVWIPNGAKTFLVEIANSVWGTAA